MNSYPLIQELFNAVLVQSQTIQGRFFVSSYNGREINTDTVGELLTEVLTNVPMQKYPLAMMLPPVLTDDVSNPESLATFTITMFFLRTSYYTGNIIEAINENTQTSTRSILYDWGDMLQSAVMFIRVLELISQDPDNMQSFQLVSAPQRFIPLSGIGADRVSGVQFSFDVAVSLGCDLEDYTDIDLVINQMSTLLNTFNS